MRALHVVTCLAGLALGVPLASRADGPRLAPVAPRVRSLPPGLWFVEGHYESHALEAEPPAPRFVVATAITTSACGGGVQTLEGSTASSTTNSTASSTTSSSASSASNNTNVATSESSGGETTSVSTPFDPEDYPPPCGRG